MPSHTHGAGTLRASSAGRHHHTIPMARDIPTKPAGTSRSLRARRARPPAHSHDVTGATGSGGAHTHAATAAATGGAAAINIIHPVDILLPIIRY